ASSSRSTAWETPSPSSPRSKPCSASSSRSASSPHSPSASSADSFQGREGCGGGGKADALPLCARGVGAQPQRPGGGEPRAAEGPRQRARLVGCGGGGSGTHVSAADAHMLARGGETGQVRARQAERRDVDETAGSLAMLLVCCNSHPH